MFDSYAQKARPSVSICVFLFLVSISFLILRDQLHAQDLEGGVVEISTPPSENQTVESVQTPDETPEPTPIIVDETTVSTQDQIEGHDGEIDNTEESAGETPADTVENQNDTPNTVSTNDTDIPVSEVESHELPVEEVVSNPVIDDVVRTPSTSLVPVSLNRIFSPSQPIVFTFTSEHPFVLDDSFPPVSPPRESSFAESVVEAIGSVVDTVTSGLTSVADAIGDRIADTFAFMSGDTEVYIAPEEVVNEAEVSVPVVIESVIVDVPSPPLEVVFEEVPSSVMPEVFNEPIPSDTVSGTNTVPHTGESSVVVEDVLREEIIPTPDPVIQEADIVSIEIATTSTTTIAQNIVYIDGVPTPIELQVVNEKELIVSFPTTALTPGTHHITMQIIVGDSIYYWEGDIVWQGTVVREVVLNDTYRVYVTEQEEREELWFLDMSQPGYEYVLLAEDGTFSSTTPISFIDTSIQWLASNEQVLNGYDVRARTVSSQIIEPHRKTVVVFDSAPYEMIIDDMGLSFRESDELMTLLHSEHEFSF